MTTFDDEYVTLRRRLRALHQVYGIPKAKLARECAVATETIGLVLAGRRPHMGLDTLQKLQDGLGRVLRERESLLQNVTGGRAL